MAEISSLKLALAQRGTIAPEVRLFRAAMRCSAWGKSACVHGIVDGMKMGSVGNPSSKQASSRVSWLGMGRSRLDERKWDHYPPAAQRGV